MAIKTVDEGYAKRKNTVKEEEWNKENKVLLECS